VGSLNEARFILGGGGVACGRNCSILRGERWVTVQSLFFLRICASVFAA
jgi:hypothetical protein